MYIINNEYWNIFNKCVQRTYLQYVDIWTTTLFQTYHVWQWLWNKVETPPWSFLSCLITQVLSLRDVVRPMFLAQVQYFFGLLSVFILIYKAPTVKKGTWLSRSAIPWYTRRTYPNLCSYFINQSNLSQTYKDSPILRKLLCVLLWECVPIYLCTEMERDSLSTLPPKQEYDPKKLGWTSDKWLKVIITTDSAGAAEK